MAEREKTYWWHVGRLQILKSYLSYALQNKPKRSTKILNVGCGTGGTIDMLEQFGIVDNIDVSTEAINFMKQAGYKRIQKTNGKTVPYKDKYFDAIAAFDVLEHIEDDETALKEWNRVLKPDGAIIISVPAYQWLWSGHDVSLHHKRRYTTSRLKQTAAKAGLRPQKLSYAIVFSLPLIVSFRLINKLLGRKTDSETSYVNVPEWVNNMFIKFLYLEARLQTKLRFPFGTSVMTILRKTNNG